MKRGNEEGAGILFYDLNKRHVPISQTRIRLIPRNLEQILKLSRQVRHNTHKHEIIQRPNNLHLVRVPAPPVLHHGGGDVLAPDGIPEEQSPQRREVEVEQRGPVRPADPRDARLGLRADAAVRRDVLVGPQDRPLRHFRYREERERRGRGGEFSPPVLQL